MSGPTVIFGRNAALANASLIATPGIRAETAVLNLSLEGFTVPSSTVCWSGKVTVSHALTAMGVPGEPATGAMRGQHRPGEQRK